MLAVPLYKVQGPLGAFMHAKCRGWAEGRGGVLEGGGGGAQESRYGNSQVGPKVEGLGDADPEVEAQGANVKEHGQQP